MKTQCLIEGCGRDSDAKGMCKKHYARFRNGGDPHVPSRKEMSLEDRFREKLSSKNPITSCIEWMGSRNAQGYGLLGREGKLVRAHRLAYELKHGPIPAGLDVLHECDNPPCCNEEHLFLGTDADNMKDRDEKGRRTPRRGENHPNTTLTDADVVEIRRRFAAHETRVSIAEHFGVNASTVGRIVNGKSRTKQANGQEYP
jgi:hypothetical protein